VALDLQGSVQDGLGFGGGGGWLEDRGTLSEGGIERKKRGKQIGQEFGR